MAQQSIEGVSDFNGLCGGATIKRSVAITASTTSGQIVSIQNPYKQKMMVERHIHWINTGATGACQLDAGTATTSTLSDNLVDGDAVGGAAPDTIYDNFDNPGANGKFKQELGVGDYLTVSVASGDANGLVADFYWRLMPMTGGSVISL